MGRLVGEQTRGMAVGCRLYSTRSHGTARGLLPGRGASCIGRPQRRSQWVRISVEDPYCSWLAPASSPRAFLSADGTIMPAVNPGTQKWTFCRATVLVLHT